MELFDLSGKKAIVTGAANENGLCFSMASGLVEAGATVVLMDISDKIFDTAKAAGGEKAGFHAVKADFLDNSEIERGFNDAMEILGGIDILVNGAGTLYRQPAVDYPIDKWNEILQVDLSSVFVMSQLAGREMIKNGSGKIINIASMNSFRGGITVLAYTSAKGGVMQLTKALSNEWMPLGVNVNAIAPGFMETEMSVNLRQLDKTQEIPKRIPAGRWGLPSDVKGAAIFLASPASDYISGAIIPVDGGFLSN